MPSSSNTGNLERSGDHQYVDNRGNFEITFSSDDPFIRAILNRLGNIKKNLM